MKTLYILLYLGLGMGIFSSQVGIDKTTGLGANSILEFGSQARGIRLSPIENVNNMIAPVPGTIVFDGATGSLRFLSQLGWSAPRSGGIIGGGIVLPDVNKQGVIINATSSSVPGALILGKDTGEARILVLPNVGTPESKMLNPPTGLIVYDMDTDIIKVWNGNSWKFY